MNAAARTVGLDLNRRNKAFLRELEAALGNRPEPTVAILVSTSPSRLLEALKIAYPQARLIQQDITVGGSLLHVGLAANGPFDVVVDDTRRRSGRVQLLRNVFFHVKPGGAYIVRNFRAGSDQSVAGFVSRQIVAKSKQKPSKGKRPKNDYQALTSAVGRVVVDAQHVLLTNRICARAKLTEDEANALLELRGGAAGRVLEKSPAFEFTSRATLTETDSKRKGSIPEKFQVPAHSLREYADVTCVPGQLVIKDNLLLPDTYRRHRKRRLTNMYLQDVSPRFAMPKVDVTPNAQLSGAYFHLDSEFRGHFGHAITEQLSRLWAWQAAKEAEPDLRALMALNKGRELADFEIALFGAAGVAPSDITFVRGPVQVEKLLAATPMLSQPMYVHPDIQMTWNQVSERLAASAPTRDYPRKIFCARRISKRPCHNATEVEAVFAEHGFDIIHTEDFPLSEQAMIFRQAEVIAGFAGSALFNLCLSATPKRVIILSSESYYAWNEYMIASVLGHHIDLAWCPSDIPMPEGRWDNRAFHSPFRFDFERDGDWLRQVLRST